MKVGDIVLVRGGWSAILGIGVITGAYRFAPEDKYNYCHRRPVQWLTTQPRPTRGGVGRPYARSPRRRRGSVAVRGERGAPAPSAPMGARPTEGPVATTTNEALNTILHGPPGTGKTWALKERAARLIGVQADEREAVEREWAAAQLRGQVELVTFHPSMSYEEFVEGLRPVLVPARTGSATMSCRGCSRGSPGERSPRRSPWMTCRTTRTPRASPGRRRSGSRRCGRIGRSSSGRTPPASCS
jgi:5-methylcytosine-specific restriction protein B